MQGIIPQFVNTIKSAAIFSKLVKLKKTLYICIPKVLLFPDENRREILLLDDAKIQYIYYNTIFILLININFIIFTLWI